MSRRRSGTWISCCLVIPAIVCFSSVCLRACSFLEIIEQGYHSQRLTLQLSLLSSSLSLLNIAPDCGRNDLELNKEMEKQFVYLLTEELKLQAVVGEEHMHHMNITFGEARRPASQYQREAEKCNIATETCEQARERAEALLTKERKVTSLWEQRARQLGWE